METLKKVLLIIAALLFISSLSLAQDECYDCHINEEDPLLRNPAIEVKTGSHTNLSCQECHRFDLEISEDDIYTKDHRGVPRRLSPSMDLQACAKRCHDDVLPLRHGKSVNLVSSTVSDDIVITCTGCHERHSTKSTSERDSWINRVNIPITCSGRDGLPCHKDEKISLEYKIVPAYIRYLESGHGRMQELGYLESAVCVDCHGPNSTSHRILEFTDPDSSINPDNRDGTCKQKGCHIGNFTKLYPGSMHGKPEYNILRIPVESIIDIFYSALIILFVGGAVLFIALDLIREKVGGPGE